MLLGMFQTDVESHGTAGQSTVLVLHVISPRFGTVCFPDAAEAFWWLLRLFGEGAA